MSLFFSRALTFTRAFVGQIAQTTPPFQTLFPKGPNDACISSSVAKPWLFNIVRGTSCVFIPKESIRVKRHGYYAKVKTRKGRKQIMRRILKGRFVITH